MTDNITNLYVEAPGTTKFCKKIGLEVFLQGGSTQLVIPLGNTWVPGIRIIFHSSRNNVKSLSIVCCWPHRVPQWRTSTLLVRMKKTMMVWPGEAANHRPPSLHWNVQFDKWHHRNWWFGGGLNIVMVSLGCFGGWAALDEYAKEGCIS